MSIAMIGLLDCNDWPARFGRDLVEFDLLNRTEYVQTTPCIGLMSGIISAILQYCFFTALYQIVLVCNYLLLANLAGQSITLTKCCRYRHSNFTISSWWKDSRRRRDRTLHSQKKFPGDEHRSSRKVP